MINPETFLTRIFSLARRAPMAADDAVPYGLETAVLAHWRDARAQRSGNGALLRGWRWAACAACAAAILAGALANDELTAFRNRFDPEARLADSAASVGYGYE